MDVRDKAVIAGIAAALALSACSTQKKSSAPFHVYNSPLLASDIEPRRPASRSFDPSKLGDHQISDRVYVINGETDTDWSTPEEKARKASVRGGSGGSAGTGRLAQASEPDPAAESQGKLPPLSTHRSSGVGGHSTTAESASETSESDGGAIDYTPARAAEFVWSVYELNGTTLTEKAKSHIPAIYKSCKKKGEIYHSSEPVAGDLVFFHNTYDANDDGRNNDWYTHVGIVDRVGENGTVEVLGYRDGEVRRTRLNLKKPDAVKIDGDVANSQIRNPSSDDAPFTRYHAGQLFAGFCSMLGDKSKFLVVDNWQPGMKLER